MCMKNISTDIVFFGDLSAARTDNDDFFNLYNVAKEIPCVDVRPNDEKTWLIPRISLMLSVNAIKNINRSGDEGKDKCTDSGIDFNKKYVLRIRVTETTSGQCVDIGQLVFSPTDGQITLCKHIYAKRFLCKFDDIVVTIPPEGKDLCVFKVILQEFKEGEPLDEDKWVVQSIHPVKMKLVD